MSIGCFGPSEARQKLLTATQSYYSTKFIIVVPPGRPYTAFENIFRPFQKNTWICLGILFGLGFLVIIVIRFQALTVPDFVYGAKVRGPFLNMYNLFLGGSSVAMPTRNFARTLFFLWIYFSFITRNLYQAKQFQFLQAQDNSSHLQTIQQLIDQNYKFYAHDGTVKYLGSLPAIMKR